MNYFDLYSSYPDRTIAAAWDSQVKEADNNPWLACTLTECGGDLFARFAACYAELRALPRGARRALQRQIARSGELAAILPEYLQHRGRRLQHRMAWSLAGAALLLALGQGVATAATITVTTSNPNIAADGQCSLIEAIVNANNDAATHPDCAAGSGADTIVLPANANLILSAAYGNANRSYGLPRITSRITIEGNGATIARQGNAPPFTLVAVSDSGDLTLQSVTLSGGSQGVANLGALTIANSIITGNTGNGVSNYYRRTLTVASSTISGNASGIFNLGTLGIDNSTISDNRGSGVSNIGTLTIANSTISGNTGGGVFNEFYCKDCGTLNIQNSTISGNASNSGGGGVFNYGGRLTISNSTISGNIGNIAGGIFNQRYYNDYCKAFNACSDGTLTLNNTLIAGNQGSVAGEVASVSVVNSNNFNLFGSNGNAGVSGLTPGPTDIVPSVSLAQILGPLQNNGGPTQTHALVAGSPAIDAGNPGGCRDSQGALLASDQRGFTRHVDGNNDGLARCDIGAVEGLGFAAPVDFDGDGKSDLTIYRDGVWFVLRSSNEGGIGITWGGALQDVPVPGDYDGDGKTDQAVYRDGVWWILRSSDGGGMGITWGGAPQDMPVPGDYDGDGKTDQAVYRDGVWWILRSSDGGGMAVTWGGAPEDLPVPGDYDGDGKTDQAVYRDGVWWILRSSNGGGIGITWGGAPQDKPMPADYDGDGKTDLAVYRDGVWYILRSSNGGGMGIPWGGAPQDIPLK
jgi:hypothetical protein